jgi:predicted nucleic acid-binding protein
MSARYPLLLETSFFIRFLTGNHPQEQQVWIDLLRYIQTQKIDPYTSPLIIWECSAILIKTHHLTPATLQPLLQVILDLPNLTLLETTNTQLALKWHWQTGVEFSHCLIATQLTPGMILCTYDREFKKLPSITCQTPAEILEVITREGSVFV